MSNSNRFLRGDRKPIRVPVDSTIVIEVGDMCFLNTDDLRPASSEPAAASNTVLRQNFANHFIGVAIEQHKSGDTNNVAVDVSGESVYLMDQASATAEVGDKLTATIASGSNSTAVLADQSVLKTTTASEAFGHTVKREPVAVTRLECSFCSAYADASSNVNAQVG